MTRTPRIAFLHTGAVVIAPVGDLAREHLGDATTVNYLDDKIVADLGDAELAASVPERIADLVQAAQSAGADIVMLTCSSISHLAAPTAERVGIPVLRIDEAMADEAVATGARIAVLATLADHPHPDDRADPRARGARRSVRPRSRAKSSMGRSPPCRPATGRRTTASWPPRSNGLPRQPMSWCSRRRPWPALPPSPRSMCRCSPASSPASSGCARLSTRSP